MISPHPSEYNGVQRLAGLASASEVNGQIRGKVPQRGIRFMSHTRDQATTPTLPASPRPATSRLTGGSLSLNVSVESPMGDQLSSGVSTTTILALMISSSAQRQTLPSKTEHIFECKDRGIGLKSAVMEYAIMQRGVPYTRYNSFLVVAEPLDANSVPFRQMNGPSASLVGREFCNRKDLSRKLTATTGANVPRTKTFTKTNVSKAWDFAKTLPNGAVIKPIQLSRGRGITTGIVSWEQFEKAWERAFKASGGESSVRRVIVEEYFEGEDFRCFAVGDEFVSATQRKRANVVGDGSSTIGELIDQKNEIRANHASLNPYLIPTDIAQLDRLAAQGLDKDFVPSLAQEVTLRNTSNLSGGGDSIDLTDTVSPGFRDLVCGVVRATPGVEYAGVDIIAPSIEVRPDQSNYVVTEVEFSPAPITDFPVVGRPRDMAGAILDFYLRGT